MIKTKTINIKEYFCLGRHRNIDCFYLTQTYSRVCKQQVRDNVNLVILFKQNLTNLKHVFNDLSIGCDLKFDEFQKFCSLCWKEKYGFAVIDMDSDVNCGRYRRGFSEYLKYNNSE